MVNSFLLCSFMTKKHELPLNLMPIGHEERNYMCQIFLHDRFLFFFGRLNNVFQNGDTVLTLASMRGDTATVKELLLAGADVSARSNVRRFLDPLS